MAKYYLTAAIDYSNGEPHLGHAFEKIGADAIARYHRSIGDTVHFVIGMDENGQSIAQEATRRELSPQALVDSMAERFRDVWLPLAISFDDFIRTTEPRHERAVCTLLRRIQEAGDLYTDHYAGYYCVRCEAFKKEDDLIDGRCPLHPTREVEWTEEENWFFRLSSYRDPLLEHIRANPDFVQPRSRRNEILRLLEGGLDDISASRARIPWGIPFPGEEGHTVYVWFDALPNYITAAGFPEDGYRRWWPADLHVIGKDITRFHCVIWPAMLLSAGLELPKMVWAHGFLTIGGFKLSKSAGTEIQLSTLIERHGPDALRYFLLREIPWDGDRDFSSVDGLLKQFDDRYNGELANDLGNLLNRVVSMVARYRDGRVPAAPAGPLGAEQTRAVEKYRRCMDELLLSQGLAVVFSLVRASNAYVDEVQPWKLAREEGEAPPGTPARKAHAALDCALADLVRALGTCAALLAPFIPAKAAELWRALGGEGHSPALEGLNDALDSLRRVAPGPILFPRFDPS